ncbi:MAG TPA: hypothetical protein VJC11_01760, partial [Patescibacteria group bacterium]|nr:hypothetical protein [Patescibacteria group bacterium]
MTRQIPVSGRMETPAKASVPDGNYTMRFSIYTVNRTSADTFPSDTDSGSRLWTETQTVAVERGVWRTTLGAVTALPSTLNFDSGNYFLGIRVNTDSEMIPRKKILPVPLAIDSESVGGSLSGTGANNVLKLDSSGSINIAGNITTAGSLQAANFLFTGTVDLPVDSVLTGDILDGTISTIDLADSVITTVKIADGSITNVKLSTGDLHFQNTDTGTTSLSFGLGTGTAVGTNNFSIPVSNAANKPAVRYNGSTGKWQISNDGTTFSDILLSAAAGITSLNGLTGTTQTFANDANITITSVGTTHTLVWSGTLGVARGGTGTGTTFTTGSVLFAGASGVYAQDNANFFWDNSAKRLGIGTASPSVQLEIYNSTANPTIRIHGDGANTIDPTLIFATNSNNYGNIRYDRSENNFYITNGYNDNTTNGGIRLGTSEPSGPAYNFILQSKTGNVGIGAAITPAAKLHVQGGTTSSGATTMTAAGAASTFTTSASITINAGDYIIPTTTTSQSRAVTVGGTGTSFTVSPVFAANVTAETFTIYHPITNLVDNSGNSKLFVQGGTGIVGLGTIAPNPFANNVGTLLHAVADNSNFIIESPLGANNEAMIMFSKVGEFGAPKWSFGRSTWGGANPDTLSLFEDNTTANTRLTVMAGGNVGIGTATPEAKLDVRGSIQIESGSDSTIRGNLEIHQLANGDNIFWAHRQTDSSPTGNFIQYQNGARTSTLFAVD